MEVVPLLGKPENKRAIKEIEETEPIVCKFCGSPNIIKYGKSGKKQVYKCKNCK
ncbi:MAG: transposase-like zinc-binding domain-containing protein [Candidatus Baldrarchaeia archaeon]